MTTQNKIKLPQQGNWYFSSTYLHGSHPAVFITQSATLILSNTTQVYFDSNCAFTRVLHVSACTQTIPRHVNTKML